MAVPAWISETAEKKIKQRTYPGFPLELKGTKGYKRQLLCPFVPFALWF